MALKGNKGEWSEIYTFFHILASGRLDVADENLEAVPGEFYKVLEILRRESDTDNRYIREDDRINIVVRDENGETQTLSAAVSDFAENSRKLLSYLKGSTGRSASFPDIEQFLSGIKVYSVKDTGHKRDITIKIEDFHCGMQQTLGFSIKSLIGHDSTLFNAGSGTNFIYEIVFPEGTAFDCDRFNRETYPQKKSKGVNKIGTRIQRLENEYGATIKFSHIQSETLYCNLYTMDGVLPQLMAEMLLARFRHNKSRLADCVNILQQTNPLGANTKHCTNVYEYKVKRFLQDVAMGMTAETDWRGTYDATGGQIVVKDSGDVVCYHIYELNSFLNFLLGYSYFETPSTSEDKNNPGHAKPNPNKKFLFGWVYEENGKHFIKLNLQVRMQK